MAQNIERQWQRAAEQSRLSSAERRERVFAHPDLVRRLTERPLALDDPYRWSGWIPPRTLPEDACPGCATHSCAGREHTARLNRSPFRQQVVDIAAEALRREHQPALDEVE
jgi:hypothetical protein